MLFSKKSAPILAAFFALSALSVVLAQDDVETAVATVTGPGTETATATSASGTSTSNVDTCITQCTIQAAANSGCANPSDMACICSSTTFYTNARSCIQSSCPAPVASQAVTLQTCTGVGAPTATTSGASKSMVPSGSGTKSSSFSGIIQHTTALTIGASVTSSGRGSPSNFVFSGAEYTFQTNSLLGLASVLTGVVFGMLVV